MTLIMTILSKTSGNHIIGEDFIAFSSRECRWIIVLKIVGRRIFLSNFAWHGFVVVRENERCSRNINFFLLFFRFIGMSLSEKCVRIEDRCGTKLRWGGWKERFLQFAFSLSFIGFRRGTLIRIDMLKQNEKSDREERERVRTNDIRLIFPSVLFMRRCGFTIVSSIVK